MLVGAVASCNSDDSGYDITYDVSEYSSVMMTSFRLQANDSILANLDTVYFAIDINNAKVFNADSLPKGTEINKLQVMIGLPTVKSAKLIVPGATAADKADTINYIDNPNDTVDFSRGPVTLRVVSLDEKTTFDYELKVNVHNMVPDSLYWNRTQATELPGGLSGATAQGSLEHDGKYLTFVTDGTNSVLCTTANPGTGVWEKTTVTLPAGAQPASAVSAGDALYMTTASGTLYTSADGGKSWTSTGTQMNHVYGAMAGKVIGVRHNSDDTYTHVTYPASTERAVSADCPVSGTSQALVYTTEWSTQAMMMFTGGVKADGTYTGDTWAYDGGEWASISNAGMPAAEGMTVVPYFMFRVNDAWVANKESVLLAFGGRLADGTMNRVTYLSKDRGVNWAKAGELMQLPDYIPGMYGAQALVADTELTGRSRSVWNMTGDRHLAGWYYMEGGMTDGSRAVKPITSWECPYIYIIGGTLADGSFNTTIWRGVINRLSFKPLQ